MIRLGVNIDHVATLRNARGGSFPDPVMAAEYAIAAGADGITAHLREDRRHIGDADMPRLRALSVPLNFEMGATDEMIGIACDLRPHACCLVPEKRQEVTTEGGLDVVGQRQDLKVRIARLKDAGIRVSLFIDPETPQIETAAELGAPVVELHTGAYAHGGPDELQRLQRAAKTATTCGLELHAGHGLTYANVGSVAALPGLVELNIGHFLIGQAIFNGLGPAVSKMKALINGYSE
ncbi:pyridoxine 5'-phosphate synthase [Gluconobacter kanchanaburiensis]|uniref:Pyridoxine 5'-phosphate synthase n=1 Tax=Gluconobacter kanchanaburiensis NBRC 103587 TaxID=1307948 RepID=A0A511B881_9PROT|nr:pyridoxine 5'-phosphate synthase [Gluconobacter kanchanaburiensis]MBF0862508.1 pyridoxine 5'-phosphate synthase [Gluconobacter kanchanaburiensis]GBR71770.1 pyridoxine 5'-phosphate synthase [Gluconobacter kanchanaburiensis NBRC 103587]GEK96629.1 pyridoxine 5'-phosphate synthase [Gluconobacter kanchanaburiensis NBRC 103587]